MNTASPKCAVVFKAYAWDSFVERQARRLAESAGALDFYVLMDETGGPVGSIPFERVVRFTCADLEAGGLAMRFAVGGVLWWNPDYAHYHFQQHHPEYDHYLFVEYDCVVQCSLERFVDRAIAQEADLVALPITRSFDEWHWTPYQRDVYPAGENKLALLNVSLFTSAALTLLHQRRLRMNVDPSVLSWPSSELFVPSEIVRAGMKWLSLAEFGDVNNYDWFPPTMEDDLHAAPVDTFLHPVLDRGRYITSMLHNKGSLRAGELKRALARFPRQEYARLIWPLARKGAARRIQHKITRWRAQMA
jgi:hypothetical protein